jgi:glutathione S-transferase
MLELYHNLASTCSQKVRLCLAEKRLDYVSHEISLADFENLSEEYLAINPHGVVPTLIHDGETILESSVICEYLDEIYPVPALSPSSALGRARMRAWMRYNEEVPTAAIRVSSFYKLWREEIRSIPEREFEQLSQAMSVRRGLFTQLRRSESHDDPVVRESLDGLKRMMDRMEKALEDQEWLAGDVITLADLVQVPILVRLEDLSMTSLWERRPGVTRWYAAVQARPSFAAAFPTGARVGSDPAGG